MMRSCVSRTAVHGRRLLLGSACAMVAACATAAQAQSPDGVLLAQGGATSTQPTKAEPGKRPGELLVLSPDAASLLKARRGHLGLHLTDLTPELREHFGAPGDAGVLVARVTADGPGAKAGVRVGDVLIAIDGEKIGQAWDASRRVREKADKANATLEVVRNRGRQTLKAQVEHKEMTELDIGELMWKGGDPNIQIDTARINDAVKRAMQAWDRPEVQKIIERRRETEEKLQQRTRELEERIEKLERRLEGKK